MMHFHTIWASFMNCHNRLLIRRIDGLKGFPLLSFHPLAVNIQANGLFVGDGRGFDLGC